MASPKLHELTLHEARDLLRKREVSSVDLTKAVLERVHAVEAKVRAYVTVTDEFALEQARKADERLKANDTSPLLGVPMQIKDNICTSGVKTTCSSRMLESFVPPYDAHVTQRLFQAGAVMLGKGNMDEFAMGSSTENSAFFPTRNPWDLERVPGGSSGGPAAAVAAGEAFYSLGSDTGGSIRQPASFCGVVGMKPTYGRVSRYGLVAFASSLDQIGPLTKDVTDCALVLNAIAGHDPRDSTSYPRAVPDYTKALRPDVKGLRIGVPKEYFGGGVESDVAEVLQRAIVKLRELGATVGECSLPSTKYALPTYYIIAPSECSANLARYDGVKYGYSDKSAENMWEGMERTREHGFGPEVKRRIMLGTYALSSGYYDAYYLKAQKVRTLIRREFEAAFKQFDLLVSPTSPSAPFKLGEKTADPLKMYMSDICTIPVNIAGIPAVSLPAGFSYGMPVGMQLMAPAFGEEALLRAAYAYEQAVGWHKLRPPV
ncbi:MAG: Asp-tRNA(Asn)/Glu-tRNA(Gln) amidotransferase subunit GatA [Dehalococcoidia bacterium]|nr:Asp-tRNA(Asn)/Glu-tRNA(Gln) amidotransferase subunit GatA [Dehalococcoidia bacterium]